MDSCLCLDEKYTSFVLETFNDKLLELHQDKTSIWKFSDNLQ